MSPFKDIWSSPVRLKEAAKKLAYLPVALSAFIALLGLLARALFDPQVANYVAFGAILLGLLVGLALQGLRHRVDTRAKELEAQELLSLKRTVPICDAHLLRSAAGKYLVHISTRTGVPFAANWHVVNRAGHALSGIMMGSERIFPSPNTRD